MTDDVEFEAVPAEDAIRVIHNGYAYPMAASKLTCPSCGGHQEPNGFVHEQEQADIRALGLGANCTECGEDALHIAYPGERI